MDDSMRTPHLPPNIDWSILKRWLDDKNDFEREVEE